MSVINFRRREIIAKVVYYGPGLSGKTTNVQQIFASMPTESRGELTSLATEQDRTLFFDYVPLHLGNIGGFKTKFQIFTVPGQVYYSATRRVVLQATDGVVFVADSSPDAMDKNLESLSDLRQNLLFYDKFLNSIPFVIQYNKRDLPNALPLAVLEQELNPIHVPSFEAIAMDGAGVLETLSKVSSLVLTHLKASIEGKLSHGRSDPGIIESFEEKNPDDEELVRQLLAQITKVRKDEHVAEVSIIDDDDLVPKPMFASGKKTGTFSGFPSMTAVNPHLDLSPGTSPSSRHRQEPMPPGNSGHEIPSRADHAPARSTANPATSVTEVSPANPPYLQSSEPAPRSEAQVNHHATAKAANELFGRTGRFTGEFALPTANNNPVRPPAPPTSAPPEDPPPWSGRSTGNLSNPTLKAMGIAAPRPSGTSRPIGIPVDGRLDIVDVSTIKWSGSELQLALTVRSAENNELKVLPLTLRLGAPPSGSALRGIHPTILGWMGMTSAVAVLALILSLF